ncbi:hypothetical protein NE237_000592 [Protea cynaroides]|uniref:Uncharacterized protein n=1 Tax=Protea cynaroides TaxID=273540 RepID=A0A9Q0KSJ5_9MAGN|nr:hypothetical protein NE237_000592 [Protea cynaroides]
MAGGVRMTTMMNGGGNFRGTTHSRRLIPKRGKVTLRRHHLLRFQLQMFLFVMNSFLDLNFRAPPNQDLSFSNKQAKLLKSQKFATKLDIRFVLAFQLVNWDFIESQECRDAIKRAKLQVSCRDGRSWR